VRKFDADGDGEITLLEMNEALCMLDLGLSQAQLQVILHGVFRGRESLALDDFFRSIALVFRHAEDNLAANEVTEEQRLIAEAVGRIAQAVAVTPISQLGCESAALAEGRAASTSMSELVAEKMCIVFNAIDKDHSGHLDADEFVSGLWGVPAVSEIRLSNGAKLTEPFLHKVAHWLDKNNSGTISIFEFLSGFEVEDPLCKGEGGLGDSVAENIVSVLLRHRNSIRAGISLFDQNESGFVLQEDFEKVLIALNDTIEETGHHWSASHVRDFCECLSSDPPPDSGLPPGSYIQLETVFDSMQVVDSEFPERGVRLGMRLKHFQ